MTAFIILLTLVAMGIYLLVSEIQGSNRKTARPHRPPVGQNAYWHHIQSKQQRFTSELRR